MVSILGGGQILRLEGYCVDWGGQSPPVSTLKRSLIQCSQFATVNGWGKREVGEYAKR